MSKRKLPPSERPERRASGPERLGHWLALHVKKYQSAYRTAAKFGLGDRLVLATPQDDDPTEPTHFGLYNDREDLYRRLPSLTANALDPGVPQSLDQERTLRINMLSGRGLQRP